MAVHPPTFNLLCNQWRFPKLPSTHAADVTNVPCQLYVSPYQSNIYVQGGAFPVYIYIPTLVKVAVGGLTVTRRDILMPDNTVAEYYLVLYKEIYYKGFLSAFLGMTVWQCNADGSSPRTY
jgi:hypothetical protein